MVQAEGDRKVCSKCRVKKHVSEFYKDKQKPDGLNGICKACVKERQAKYRDANKDQLGARSRTYYQANKEKVLAYNKTYYEANKERMLAQTKDWRARNPGHKVKSNGAESISLDDYNALLAAQGYACAICRRPANEMPRKMDIDHDHRTGKTRGLLCWQCNIGLGHFRDNAEFMRSAVIYLRTL